MFYDMTDFVSTGFYHDNCLIEGNRGNQQRSGLCKSTETKWQQTTKGEIEHKQQQKKKSNTLRGISRGVSFESRVFAISIHSSDMKSTLTKLVFLELGLSGLWKGDCSCSIVDFLIANLMSTRNAKYNCKARRLQGIKLTFPLGKYQIYIPV